MPVRKSEGEGHNGMPFKTKRPIIDRALIFFFPINSLLIYTGNILL